MKLSDNFSLKEFYVSDTFPDYADILYDHNKDNEEHIVRFKNIAMLLLQPIRDRLKKVVNILCGYRDEWLNTKVGGVASSDHLSATAVDIAWKGSEKEKREIFEWAKDNLNYRQIIFYKDSSSKFIHISLNTPDKDTKHEAFIKENNKYVPVEINNE
jgi:uncharacterized protein YcbK (DUF882 family)